MRPTAGSTTKMVSQVVSRFLRYIRLIGIGGQVEFEAPGKDVSEAVELPGDGNQTIVDVAGVTGVCR